MRHLIDRVLELQENEVAETDTEPNENDRELHHLLESLQPRIRVFGCGGCGCNTVQRLGEEGPLVKIRRPESCRRQDGYHLEAGVA